MRREEGGRTLDLQRIGVSSGNLGKVRKGAHDIKMSLNRVEKTWASSEGGPGRKREEQRGGRSIFGTA